MTATPVEPVPVAAQPAPGADDVEEIDERYLRSLNKDHLLSVLEKHEVDVPGDLVGGSAKEIVDWVCQEFGA